MFACGLLLSVAWVRHSEQLQREKSMALATDLAADHAQSLQRGIERALSATYAIAALVRQGHGKVEGFEGIATEMLPFYPGIAALGLSPGGVICCVVPLAGNEKSIGFNQLTDIAQNKEARLARDTGHLTLAGPLMLAQGGMGVVGRLPIFLSDLDGERAASGGLPTSHCAFPNRSMRPAFPCCVSGGMPTSCGAWCRTPACASASTHGTNRR